MRIVIVAVLLFAVICNVIGAKLPKDGNCKQSSAKESEMCDDTKGLMCMGYEGCMYGVCECGGGKYWDTTCKADVIKKSGETCIATGDKCESGYYCDNTCKKSVLKGATCTDTSTSKDCVTGTKCKNVYNADPRCRESLTHGDPCSKSTNDVECPIGAACSAGLNCTCTSTKKWYSDEKACYNIVVFVGKGAACVTGSDSPAGSKICKTGLDCMTCPNEISKKICAGAKAVAKGGAATAEMPARLVFFSSVLLFILNKA